MIVGHHMAYGTVADALRLIHRMGGNAIQISLGEPDKRDVRLVDRQDAQTVRKIRQKHGFYLVVHGKFLYNFCRNLEWQRKLLVKELLEAAELDADVVIHQGKNMGELGLDHTEALQAYVDNIVSVLTSPEVQGMQNRIILENSARQGTEVGYDIDDLATIFSLIPEQLHPRIGFCLDLCHAFVAGALDVRNGQSVLQWLESFERNIAPLSLVHFNDSAIPFDGANDNHAGLGSGYIADPKLGGKLEGFHAVASYCKERNIPMIMETPSKAIAEEIALVKKYAA